jgi:hypothetical protein
VSLWLAVGVLAVGEALAVGLMMLVRSRAPGGSFFHDTSEAAGVFAVVGTAFAVLLAFVFFVAFQAYDNARNDARGEADAVMSMYRTAESFPPATGQRLRAELICYGRAVAEGEWPAMRHDRSDPLVQRWIEALDHEARGATIAGAQQTEALDHWFDLAEARQDGRRGRLAEAGDIVPPLVWLVLIVGGIVVIGYTCFFADPAERRLGQAMMMLAVSSMVISSLLVIFFLDKPYQDQSGSIRPTAMRTALRVMAADRALPLPPGGIPCDATGRPRRLAS